MASEEHVLEGKREHEILSQVLNTLPVMVFAKDIKDNFKFILWNKAAEAITGLKASDCIGRSDYDFFPKDQADAFREKDISTIAKAETTLTPEEQLNSPSGVIYLRTRKTVVLDSQGQPLYLLGVSEDITDTKRVQDDLRHTKDLIEEAQRVARIGSWEMNLDDSKFQVSRQFAELLQLSRTSQLDTADISAALHNDHIAVFEKHLQACILTGTSFKIRIAMRHDRKKWIEMRAEAEISTTGVARTIRGTAQDISELVATEEQAKAERARNLQQSKLASLGEMAAGIAHEINNPLAIIAAAPTLILRQLNNPEAIKAKLEVIKKSVHRIERIVTGLRKFSRASERSTKTRHRLSSLVEEALVLVQAKARSAEVEIRSRLDAEGLIFCNDIEIEQVIVNLVNNGIDACKGGKAAWVEVQTFDQDAHVIARVIDSGTGMTPEVKSKIFQPFFTTKPVGEGTGLGLAILKGIVDDHSGTIQIDETSPNTCFQVKFLREADIEKKKDMRSA